MSSQCQNKEVCGSCSWSDLPYKEQLEKKLLLINQEFQNNSLDISCSTIIPSPKTANYRNRMDFVINYQGLVGLREKGKWWKVIDNHTCFISDLKIEDAFKIVREWTKNAGFSFFDRKSHTGLLRYAVIRATTLGEVLVIILTSAPASEEEAQKLKSSLNQLSSELKCKSLVWAVNNTNTDVSFGDSFENIVGEGFISEEINGIKYKITPNAFFQTNSHAAEILQKEVLKFSGDVLGKKILDLYCGSGFFSIPLAKAGAQVVGVEIIEEAVNEAKENLKQNNVNATFICSKSEEVKISDFSADILILDPARSGLHPSLIQQILDNGPKELIYVSCNFKRFVEEMLLLKEKYTVVGCVAVDMFPHTPHVEVVFSLKRQK